MRNISYKLFFILLAGIIFAENQSPYLEIANELIVRKKLSSKLPDVFDAVKFAEIANRLDNIALIKEDGNVERLNIDNPEFHWCYAQTYLLAGSSTESLDHYRQFKIQTFNSIASIHPLFQKPVNELENALENQQANLAHEIYVTINDFKNAEFTPDKLKILGLQNKLNFYNELTSAPKIISPDGIMGPKTKSSIYDYL